MKSIDIEAEKEVIKKHFRDYLEAENRKDLETLLKYPTDDVVILRPNEPEARGMEAVRDGWSRFFPLNFEDVGEPTLIEVSETGDLAFVVFQGKVTGDVEFNYKTLYGLKKIDGLWKFSVQCHNTH